MKLPKARTKNLLEQNLKNETLIYDLTIDKAFNLNETSTIVYKACGQNQTFAELKRKYNFTDDFIYLALDELKRENLLNDVSYQSPFAGVSRREIIKKVGLATMFVLPLISGLVAPKASEAASVASGSSGFLPIFSACINQLGAPLCVTGFCINNRCCAESAYQHQIILLPGQNYSLTDTSPIYYQTGQVPANRPCPVACCSGAQPTGSCSIAPDTINEYGDGEFPDAAGYSPYIQTCDCTC